MKKALILFDSVYGNTKKVAMSLSRGLEAGGVNVDTVFIQNFDITELKNYDVIGIGGPTHFHGASKRMKSFLTKIKHFKMEKKQGFAFETKADFRLAGSAAKRIIRYLKMIKLSIIYPKITSIVLDKEGPLQENTLDIMEQIGLNISNKVNKTKTQNDYKNKNNQSNKRKIKNKKGSNDLLSWNRLKWLLLGGGPLFFFIRAINLASIGGDCFGTINPIASWILLFLEMTISGITGARGLTLWLKGPITDRNHKFSRLLSWKVFLLAVIGTYTIHLTRVAIWIILCVI